LHRRFGAYDPVGRFISPSRFLADQISRAGVYPDRVVVLDNLTDVDATDTQAAPGRGAVFAGRLSYEKGVDTLIRAVGEVAGVAPAPLLDIAGDGPDRAALEQLAEQVAPGQVRFHGRLGKEELMALVRSAAVSVVPSRWHENQPLSVLESFSAGVPVVATTMGGLPELVREGETGWLVERDDPTQLAKALLEALGDPEEAHRRGRTARRLAEERFAPAVHLRTLGELYAAAGARS
jgi:glycosyltransferase involved in cell wall biosynthesis